MATKPRSQWSPAYRARIERAEKRGLSRQQARGHVVKEHVIRKQKEKAKEAAKEGLLTTHKESIRRYLKRLPDKFAKSKEGFKVVSDRVTQEGWPWFEGIRNARNAMIANARRGRSMPGSEIFKSFAQDFDLDNDESENLEFLLYYHD
jgi:hypothetical protein